MKQAVQLLPPSKQTTDQFIDFGLGVVGTLSESVQGESEYGPPPGVDELRELIAAHHKVAMANVCVTAGASLGLTAALAMLKKGEILCPKPFYPAYPGLIRAFGHQAVFYNLNQNTWMPDPEQIRKLLSPTTRAILINNPGNPTGRLILESLLNRIAYELRDHCAVVLCDEVAAEFIYDGAKFPCARDIFRPEKLVQIRSISKAFAAPGLRLGYIIACPQRISQLAQTHWMLSLGAALTSQLSLLKVLQNQSWGRPQRIALQLAERRSFAKVILSSSVVIPDGGIFLWFKSPVEQSSIFCDYIKAEHAINLMPGSVFGAPDHFRVCFGGSLARLKIGLFRLCAAQQRFLEKQ